MDIKLILIHGAIYAGLFTVSLVPIALKGPRLMLQDYPKEIIRQVPPKTKEEQRLTKLYAIPFLAVFILYPTFFGWYYAEQQGWNFWQILSFVWGIMLFVNVYDLLILDWLIFCTITPRFVIVPGTEGNHAYKDYMFHFMGFLKGILITLLMSLLITSILAFLF